MSRTVPKNGIQLSYALPPAVESLRAGWLASCQTAAIVSALFAVLAGTLLVFMQREENFPPETLDGRGHTLLLICSYSAVVLNVSATIGSLVLTDKLGELPLQASQRVHLLPRATVSKDNTTAMLRLYGIGPMWTYAMWHWLFCLVVGFWALILQIPIYIYLRDSKTIMIVITCVVAFAMLPLMVFVLPYGGSPNPSDSDA